MTDSIEQQKPQAAAPPWLPWAVAIAEEHPGLHPHTVACLLMASREVNVSGLAVKEWLAWHRRRCG